MKALVGLQATAALRSLTAFAKRSFPRNPWFPYLQAESYLSLGPDDCPMGAGALSPFGKGRATRPRPCPQAADQKQELIDMIENRRQMLAVISADFLGMLEKRIRRGMFGVRKTTRESGTKKSGTKRRTKEAFSCPRLWEGTENNARAGKS